MLLCMPVIVGRCFRKLKGGYYSIVIEGNLKYQIGFEGEVGQRVVGESLIRCRIESRVLRLDVLPDCPIV